MAAGDVSENDLYLSLGVVCIDFVKLAACWKMLFNKSGNCLLWHGWNTPMFQNIWQMLLTFEIF